MSSIDRRIVEARFDNKDFKKGVEGTLKDVESLKKGLKLEGAADGFAKVGDASRRLTFGGLIGGIGEVIGQFGALRLAGLAALGAITAKAVSAGTQVVRSMSLEPLIQGYQEYELKLGSIQTIMAGSGETLETVNRYLQELNAYADRTIYSFADMTTNIGKFTNAGVDLGTAVASIQGIANVAALSGANANEASRAMYNFAQALSKGYVQLIDWKSIELANMGTVEFKQQLIDAAEAQGLLTRKGDEWVTTAGNTVTATKNFNDSLTDQWLTTEVLTSTLGDYADETTDIGRRAFAAAQDVKTFTQLIDTVKEAIGSGWAQSSEIIFGDFDEAKELWTNVNDVVSEFVDNTSDARNAVLQEWSDLGGRTALIDGLAAAFAALKSFIEPVVDAFRDFFPSLDGQKLYDMTVGFRDFFESIKMGEDDAESFKDVISGLLSILGIGWEVLKQIGSFLRRIFQGLTGDAGDFLTKAGELGETVQAFYEKLKSGEDMSKFFEDLADSVLRGIDVLKDLAYWVGEAIGLDNISYEGLIAELQIIIEAGEKVREVWGRVSEVFGAIFTRIGTVLDSIRTAIMEIPSKLAEYFSTVDWNFVLSSINTGLFASFLFLLNRFIDRMGGSGISGALSELADSFSDSIGDITDSLDGVTGTLSTMQNTLRALTLTQIAIALGIMAWALTQLSRIDSADLAKALSAMAGLFVELGAALVGLQFLGGIEGFNRTAVGLIMLATAMKIMASSLIDISALSWDELNRGIMGLANLLSLVVLTTALIKNPEGLISTATGIVVLSAAIKILASAAADIADLSWEEIAKGLTGVGAMLVGLALFTKFAETSKGAVAQGAGLLLLAGAIKVLASATKDFADMDAGELAKGLGVITAVLAVFAGFTHATNPEKVLATGASLLVVSGAMVVMAGALKIFGSMSMEEIGNGLMAMGGALLAVGLALAAIPPSAIVSASALVVASGGLVVLASALKVMASMGWQEIAKAGTVLASSLLLLSIGLSAMSGTMVGSLSLFVAAAALSVLAPVLYLLGGLSWQDIGKGLAVLAGAFTLLGVAGYLLAPTVPTFIGLAAAFLMLGAGAALLGVGVNMVAQALSLMARTGADLITVVESMLGAFSNMIPVLAEDMANGFIVFMETLASAFDGLLMALTDILLSILEAVRRIMPELIDLMMDTALQLVQKLRDVIPPMAEAALEMITGIINVITEEVPTLVTAIARMLTAMLTEMANNVGDMVTAGVDLIVAFINGIADNLDRVIRAGARLIIKFLRGISDSTQDVIDAGFDIVIDFMNGVARSIRENSDELREAGANLAMAIVDGMTGGMASKAEEAAEAARGLASRAWNAATSFFDARSPSRKMEELGGWVGDGLAIGIRDSAPQVARASETTGKSAVEAMRKSMSEMADAISMDDFNPTVTPVIDMSEIKKGAQEISSTLGSNHIRVGAAYSKAKDASNRELERRAADEGATPIVQETVQMSYVQNNYSPKSLSAAEIYRQTKNQLSTAKGALTPNAS